MSELGPKYRRLRELMFPAIDGATDDGPGHERLPIPHTFGPRLSILKAFVFAIGSLTRIFLGSLLFALWGTAGLMTWGAVENPFLRVLATTPMLVGFLACTGAMLVLVTLAAERITRAAH
jgi:hypothetical protein